MIEERIAEVRVRVRTDIPDVAAIRPAAERIVRAALEHCAALLEERAPGRVVLIRRLPLCWRLDESVLDDATQVEDLARAAADAVERISRPLVLDPPASEDGAVIFEDEAHLRASHLLALARGRPAWFHAVVEDPAAVDPLAILAAPERRATAHATLVWLARENVLAEVLAARPVLAVAVFAAALGCDLQQVSLAQDESTHGATGTQGLGTGGGDIVAELTAIASYWPTLAPAARSLALRVHAAVLLDVELAAPEAIALAAAVLQSSSPIAAVEPARVPRPEAIVPEGRVPANDRAALEKSPEHAAAVEPEESTVVVTTRCGGLFYLFDRVQELDFAESLWKACLPEGAVLAAAMSALLVPTFAGDPAPALFGGIDTVAACPEVTPEQHAEITVATCAALAAALPRRGIADIPPAMVSLADHPTGRLLVAAAENSPFVFFAWPAATPEMLRTGLRALLDTWPHRGILTASPALVTLDTTGRLRLWRDPARNSLLLPEAPSACASALLALVAGAPSLLFAARAGVSEPYTVEDFVVRRLAHQARIRRSADRMEVIFNSSDLDLDARRAGLDRNPGWLPWLRCTVRFVFEGQVASKDV